MSENQKPFDINKPYQTRDGREAEVIVGPDGRLFGWIGLHNGSVCACQWYPDGSYYNSHVTKPDDLVNIPERRTVKVWINCYETGHETFKSRDEANSLAGSWRIACVEREITYEPGEGLS